MSSNLMAEAKPKTEIEGGSKSYFCYFCGMNDTFVTMQTVPMNPYFVFYYNETHNKPRRRF